MLVFALFGLKCALVRTLNDKLLSWVWCFGGWNDKRAWKLVPLCLMWTTWCERNRRSFEGVEMPLSRLTMRFFEYFVSVVFLGQ